MEFIPNLINVLLTNYNRWFNDILNISKSWKVKVKAIPFTRSKWAPSCCYKFAKDDFKLTQQWVVISFLLYTYISLCLLCRCLTIYYCWMISWFECFFLRDTFWNQKLWLNSGPFHKTFSQLFFLKTDF